MSGLDWLIINGDTVTFNIPPTYNISYSDLPTAVLKVYNYYSNNKFDIIRITGRGPIWLYTAIVHAVAHLAKAIAVYDAINKKYVVVVSHDPMYKIGTTID